MGNARSIPVADGDLAITVLGNVVELWSVSEAAGFSVFATQLEALIDGLLRAYIETGQAMGEAS